MVHRVSYFLLFMIPFIGMCSSSSYEHLNLSSTHKNIYNNFNDNKVASHQRINDITIHGLLLWLSMGLLMPIGILTIRVSSKEQNAKWKRAFFYIHVIFQIVAVLLATAGAIMSIKKFDNSFNNNHQRLGLALYASLLLQTFLGFSRPKRGTKWRSKWYFVHWMVGTTTSLVGIFNTYTGLKAYHLKTTKSVALWTILFTAQVSFIGFFYLFQDKWDYIQNLGQTTASTSTSSPTPPHPQQHSINPHKLLFPPQPCQKPNALKNLFDL